MDDLYPEIQRGTVVATRRTINVGDVTLFATLSGDLNPLHLDASFARATRFGDLIASGQHLIGHMLGVLPTRLPATTLGLDCAFRFVKAACVGDTLAIEWVVRDRQAQPRLKGLVLSLDGRATNQRGEEVITGQVRVLLTLEP
jgi:acyl dehydratase